MKNRILSLSLLTALLLGACARIAPLPIAGAAVTSAPDDTAEVRTLVETFGKRLQTVSLLAPDAAQQIQTQYASLVSPMLVETWIKDVSKAPGRMVSSPWPDRIEIARLVRQTPDRYVIDGFVVDITSTEMANGGAAARIPVHIGVGREQGHWLIAEYAEER